VRAKKKKKRKCNKKCKQQQIDQPEAAATAAGAQHSLTDIDEHFLFDFKREKGIDNSTWTCKVKRLHDR